MLLGADPVGLWPGGERWRTLLGRAFFALQISLFQDGSTGWATTIVPASMPLEKEGTFTNLEGRVQRLRGAVRPPAGVLDGLVLADELARRLGLRLPDPAARRLRRDGQQRGAFAGCLASDREQGARRRRRRRGRYRATRRSRRRAGRHDRGRLPPADVRPRRRQRTGAALPAAPPASSSPTTTPSRWASPPATASPSATTTYRCAGPALVKRRLRPGVVRLATAIPYVGPATARSPPRRRRCLTASS